MGDSANLACAFQISKYFLPFKAGSSQYVAPVDIQSSTSRLEGRARFSGLFFGRYRFGNQVEQEGRK